MAAPLVPCSLTAVYGRFRTFLEELERTGGRTDERFVGRNFRLEERIPGARIESYRDVAESSPGDMQEWYDAHWHYLARALFVEQPPAGLPRNVDPNDAGTCAEPFRVNEAVARLSHMDPSVELVRVERITAIADAAEVPEHEALERFVAAIADPPHAASISWSDAVLGRWSRTRDLRPAWAALWEDCVAILGAQPRDRRWPCTLRA